MTITVYTWPKQPAASVCGPVSCTDRRGNKSARRDWISSVLVNSVNGFSVKLPHHPHGRGLVEYQEERRNANAGGSIKNSTRRIVSGDRGNLPNRSMISRKDRTDPGLLLYGSTERGGCYKRRHCPLSPKWSWICSFVPRNKGVAANDRQLGFLMKFQFVISPTFKTTDAKQMINKRASHTTHTLWAMWL